MSLCDMSTIPSSDVVTSHTLNSSVGHDPETFQRCGTAVGETYIFWSWGWLHRDGTPRGKSCYPIVDFLGCWTGSMLGL